MLSYLKILRAVNLLFLAFAMIGVLLLGSEYQFEVLTPRVSNFWVAFLLVYVVCSVTASGYVVNDYFDVETDAINKPNNRIVGSSLSSETAKMLYMSLLLDGLAFSALFVWLTQKHYFTLVIILTQVLLFLYAKYLKKSFLFGNFLVAVLTIAPYWLIYYVFEILPNLLPFFLFLSVSGFVLTFIRELVKDWEDLKGDKAIGAKTLPIVLGEKRTKLIAFRAILFSILIHLLLIFEFAYRHNNVNFIMIVFWPIVLMIAVQIKMLFALKKDSWSPTKLSKTLKFCMLIGVLWVYYLWLFVGFQLGNV